MCRYTSTYQSNRSSRWVLYPKQRTFVESINNKECIMMMMIIGINW